MDYIYCVGRNSVRVRRRVVRLQFENATIHLTFRTIQMATRILLSLFVVVSYCFGQSDSSASFSINSYRPLYCSKQTLSIAPNLSYNNSVNKNNEQIDSVSHFLDNHSANGSGNISAIHFYRNQHQSSDLALETNVYLYGYANSGNVTKEAGDGRDSAINHYSNSSLHEGIFHEYRHRFYLPLSRNVFTQWILRPQLDLSQGNNTSKQNTMYNPTFLSPDSSEYSAWSNKLVTSDQSFKLPIQLFLGYGSVYDVTSAAIAMNIFDRIIGKGTSENTAISHQVKNYANTIDSLRNKRVFDNRESLIADVAELCDSLQPESGTKLTPRQVMEIYDEWQYGQNQTRMKGFEVTIGPEATGYALNQDITEKYRYNDEIAPRININDYPWDEKGTLQPNSELNYRHYSAALVLIANVQYAKPLGRRFQYDGSLLYSFDIYNNYAPTVDSLLRIFPQDHANHFTLNNSFSWFANLRTTLNLFGEYTMVVGRVPDVLAYKFLTRISADYYVFSKLKFSGSLYHTYSYTDDPRYQNVKSHIPTQNDIWIDLSMSWEPF